MVTIRPANQLGSKKLAAGRGMFPFVYVIVSVNEDMNGDESWRIVAPGTPSVSVRCGEREKKGKRICKLRKDL